MMRYRALEGMKVTSISNLTELAVLIDSQLLGISESGKLVCIKRKLLIEISGQCDFIDPWCDRKWNTLHTSGNCNARHGETVGKLPYRTKPDYIPSRKLR